MKAIFISVILMLTFGTFFSCSEQDCSIQFIELNEKVDSLQKLSDQQQKTITRLRDSVEILKYSAADRLLNAQIYFDSGDLDRSENELNSLEKIFPDSPQNSQGRQLKLKIEAEKEKQQKERERIEALGFKALPQTTSVKVDYNTITLSSFSTGSQFVFDAYDDSYFYWTADRGNKYVTMSMSVKSSSKTPKIPQFAVYSINGSEMKLVERFTTEYARWSDYGAYLGNYHDNRNDFAKVSTVNFKLGAEVNAEIVGAPYAIVMYNSNVLTEHYDRWKNPPQYWLGSAPFSSPLTLESFQKDYILIKLFNLK